ncbi:MAG TPA: helix-turn-helix domain-containing protein [Polyangiaceae bacterium]|nr:helix-turn-helix domain-containing protein [Polyangiaceae bacterium]
MRLHCAETRVISGPLMESVGQFLRRHREGKRMSVEEVSRATRVPMSSVERIESDQFDELPGEVFVRGFLKSYARAVGLSAEEVLARYTASRRVAWVTPLPIASPTKPARGRRFGVAIAFVLLLLLFTLALSIVLKPRGDDMPQELSRAAAGLDARPIRTC